MVIASAFQRSNLLELTDRLVVPQDGTPRDDIFHHVLKKLIPAPGW
jgi:hypothetical protein